MCRVLASPLFVHHAYVVTLEPFRLRELSDALPP